jgi:hypothetical protein
MSAYIVREVTLNQAVERVVKYLQFEDYHYIPSGGCDEIATAIGRSLWALNQRAVSERYRHEDLDQLPGDRVNPSYVYRENHTATEGELLKSLDCLIYQCSQGDITKDFLFNVMVCAAEDFEFTAPRKTKEYEDAHWD